MVEQSGWVTITTADPKHSSRYIERFRAMEAAGDDLGGEARLVHAIAPRNSRILDAGCGPGRVGAILADLGHEVVGVDVDPVLIAAAVQDHPGPEWLVGDLAKLDLSTPEIDASSTDPDASATDSHASASGVAKDFDVIVCAGNVMTFLAPSTRREVLVRMRDHLVNDGRMVIGFGAGRGYEFNDFIADATAVGLVVELKLATWDMRPFVEDSEFLVAVLASATDRE